MANWRCKGAASGSPPALWAFFAELRCNATRAVRLWVDLLACLAQLWMPAQYRHAPAFATHTIASGAAATGLTIVSVDEGQSDVPCPFHAPRASSHDGNGPVPCDHENCPCCACLCTCSLMHVAFGMLPQETARAVFAPLLATIAVPPAFLGSRARFAAPGSRVRLQS